VTSILGLSAFYHDSAAAIIVDGKIIAAAQEERFTRIKHDSQYPFNAVEFVLKQAKLKLSEIDYVVFYEKPFLKFERLLESYVAFAPKGFKSFSMSMPLWLREKLFQKKVIFSELKKHDKDFNNIDKIYFSEHHFSHAASAFYPSPFNEAVILTLDGVGEWATTTVAKGKGKDLEIFKEIHFPHSVGLLYSAFTYYIGFKVNSGEYKVMGLAPYGEPKYKNLILDNLIDLKDDGTFRLNMDYFDYTIGLKMINKKFVKLFNQPVRNSKNDLITQFHMDIASSIQSVTEDIILKLIKSITKEYNCKNLCLAGGVALNCVANGKILEEKIVEKIWIQPAAGDAGGALGAALAMWHSELKNERLLTDTDKMQGSYLGPEYSNSEIEKSFLKLGANFKKLPEKQLLEVAAKELSNKKTIGWFQGRMEYGPRALGSRSIIADPRSDEMQKELNLKVKFRESFRPFAPSILSEHAASWFELNHDSPYMLLVSKIKKDKQLKMSETDNKLFGIEKLNVKRSQIPAVTHVDYTSRIHTVNKKTNAKYYNLLKEFYQLTKCPVLINTSFNVRGEPIVCTVEDAFRCFMGTNLEILICENFLLYKDQQNSDFLSDYKNRFELD